MNSMRVVNTYNWQVPTNASVAQSNECLNGTRQVNGEVKQIYTIISHEKSTNVKHDVFDFLL